MTFDEGYAKLEECLPVEVSYYLCVEQWNHSHKGRRERNAPSWCVSVHFEGEITQTRALTLRDAVDRALRTFVQQQTDRRRRLNKTIEPVSSPGEA